MGEGFEPRSFQKLQRCLCSCSWDLLRVTRLLPAVSASGFLAHRGASHWPQLLSRTSEPSRGDGKVPFAPLGFLTAGLGPFCREATFSRSSFICWFAGAAEGRRHLTSWVVCGGGSGLGRFLRRLFSQHFGGWKELESDFHYSLSFSNTDHDLKQRGKRYSQGVYPPSPPDGY